MCANDFSMTDFVTSANDQSKRIIEKSVISIILISSLLKEKTSQKFGLTLNMNLDFQTQKT